MYRNREGALGQVGVVIIEHTNKLLFAARRVALGCKAFRWGRICMLLFKYLA